MQSATNYTVTATGQSGSASAAVAITVQSPRAVSPVAQQVAGTVGSAINPTQPYSASGFSSSPMYSVSPSLPAGLTIDGLSGVISGTPSAPQAPTNYAVTATGQQGSAQATISITVANSQAAIFPSLQQTGATVGMYTATQVLHPTGLGSGVTYSLNGTIPPGMTFNAATGVVSGTPTSGGFTTSMDITGTGSTGSAQAGILLTVCPAGFIWITSAQQCGQAA